MLKPTHLLFSVLLSTVLSSSIALAKEVADCAETDWKYCGLRSKCTLYKVSTKKSVPSLAYGDRYKCRDAKGFCESHFQQVYKNEISETQLKAKCETKKGCEFVPAEDCWCAPFPQKLCDCSGGTPPQCR